MKISVINDYYCDEKDQFKFMKDLGYDGCDFKMGRYFDKSAVFGDIFNVTPTQIKEHFSELKKYADEAGFEVIQSHTAFGGQMRRYESEEDAIKRIEASIIATHYLGSKLAVVHPYINMDRKYDKNEELSIKQAIDLYKKLIPVLEEYDMYCCIENMWHCDSVFKHICPTILSRATEMAYVCDECGDHFRVCLDVGHCEVTQDDPVEAVHILGKRIACLHAHATDGMSDLHTFPFCAQSKPYSIEPMRTDWHEFMKALKEEGYDGALNFEIAAPGPLPVKMAGYRYLSKIGRYLSTIFEEYEV